MSTTTNSINPPPTDEERRDYKEFQKKCWPTAVQVEPEDHMASFQQYRLARADGYAAGYEAGKRDAWPETLTEEQVEAWMWKSRGGYYPRELSSWRNDFYCLRSIMLRPAKTPEEIQREREDAEDEAAWQAWNKESALPTAWEEQNKSIFLAGRRSQREAEKKTEVKP